MLKSISNFVEKYTQILSTVTNINIEVADADLIRIAGTGIYSKNVGESIKVPGNVYQHVLKNKKPIVIDSPKEHSICQECSHLEVCQETLELCTPIVYNQEAIGVIGIICFSKEERDKILPQLDLYMDFVQQISEAIALAVSQAQNSQQIQSILDTFLKITDANNQGILTLNSSNMITYLNDKAAEFMREDSLFKNTVDIKKTGDSIAGLEELELTVKDKTMRVVGTLTHLNSNDETFHSALIFDTLPNYLNIVSQGVAGQNNGGGLDKIVGGSKAMASLKQHVLKIADTKSTVLITGESGTGKEIFARAIHEISDRKDKPFIAINCGAIPDTLLESELFGYVAGAFTGARASGHVGKFEMADKGVLFLDEIGAMPLYLQVKLLRVLQERTITRLGSNRLIPIDVRIIAATNDNLNELIEQRMFREDLYYRLNVIPLKIPPLRERTEDIPLLAQHFLIKYCELFKKKSIRPTPRLIRTLQQYSWPGNVREFENIMEYLVNVIPDGGSATINMLPAKITQNLTRYVENNGISTEADIIPLDILEKEMIEKAIKKFGDNTAGKQKAADALRIGIATLYRKLK